MTNDKDRKGEPDHGLPEDENATENHFSLDETVEETDSIERNDHRGLSETVDHVDLDATLDEGNVIPVAPSNDPDATVADLDKTVEETDQTVQDTDQTIIENELTVTDANATIADASSTVSDVNETVAEDADFDPDETLLEADQTVSDSNVTVVDETLNDVDATVQRSDLTVVETEATVDLNVTLDETAEKTIPTIHANSKTREDANEATEGTILTDEDIGQTINPRELTSEDVSYWSKLSQEFHTGAATVASFSEFGSAVAGSSLPLRGRQVTTPQESETEASDYRLVRLLGKGGMGNVFVARQGSLDRLIAVKIIKPLEEDKRDALRKQGRLESTENSRRQQFLTEAVITGDLDHPNIVPIHDVAVTGENTLFYAMKRVVGTPWNKVIGEKSRDENLEILIKVADAIAFAHTRGIIHRDIKPENVMLGDFGVVMVMDWGIALAMPQFEKLNSITPAKGLGGTPSFMAPEMATGPLEAIGPAADIYLLGATLFMIVTGKAPHHAKNVRECLRAVATNEIREVDPRHEGELLNIARKAMATRIEDRYSSVIEFQEAIREYRSHSESISLAARATDDLNKAEQTLSYTLFSRATFGFEEALHLWDGNQTAREGIARARLAHASAAHDNKDFDLGLSLLKPDGLLLHDSPEHETLATKLEQSIQDRKARESRFKFLKRAVAAMLLFIFVGGAFALVTINAKEQEARQFAENAELRRKEAEEQRKIAEGATKQARNNLQLAEDNLDRALAGEELAKKNAEKADANAKEAVENAKLADRNAKEAERNEKRAELNAEEARISANAALVAQEKAEIAQAEAEYESYVSQIGLAKARVDRNEFSDARRILSELTEDYLERFPNDPLPWELRWLAATVHQSKTVASLPVIADQLLLAQAPTSESRRGLIVQDNGRIATFSLASSSQLTMAEAWDDPDGGFVTASAMNASGEQVALGMLDGKIEIWNGDLSKRISRLPTHDGPVSDLGFADSNTLVSSSTDRTIRLWNLNSRNESDIPAFSEHWHVGPVTQVTAVRDGETVWVAAAVNDSARGRVAVWNIGVNRDGVGTRVGRFMQHDSEVSALSAWMEDDSPVFASGDTDGNVFVWGQGDLVDADPKKSIESAVQDLASVDASNTRIDEPKASAEPTPIHRGGVQAIRYDKTIDRLITAGKDYVVRTWKRADIPHEAELGPWARERSLRGHGGAVKAAVFVPASGGDVLSLGDDQTLRYWESETGRLDSRLEEDLTSARASSNQDSAADGLDAFETAAHDDEIWSARFSPDGTKVVTSSRDHTARVLSIDPDTSRFVTRLTISSDQSSSEEDGGTLEEGSAFGAMSMRMDPVHRRLFLGNADATVRIWDIDRGTELGSVRGTGLNDVMAVSKDGSLLATGSSSTESDVLVWKLDPSKEVSPRLLHRLNGHEESVAALAISPDSQWLFSGDRAGRGRVWDLQTGEPVGEPIDDLLGFRMNTASFAGDSKSVWVGSDNQSLMRWRWSDRTWADRHDTNGFVMNLVVSPDGRQAITIDQSKRTDRTISNVTWWDLSNGKQQRLLSETFSNDQTSAFGGRPNFGGAAFSTDGRLARLVVTPAGGRSSRVETWDLSGNVGTAKRVAAVELPERIGECTAVASLQGDRFVTMHGNAAFRWDGDSNTHLMSYRAHGAVTRATFAGGDRRVITASRSVKVWDAETGKTVGKLESPHEGTVRAIAISPKETFRLVTGGDDSRVHVWDFDEETGSFQSVRQWNDPILQGGIASLDFSPDGSCLLATTNQGAATLMRMDGKATLNLVADPSLGKLNVGRFSNDSRWVAVGGSDNVARMWDVSKWFENPRLGGTDMKAPIQLIGHAEPIADLAVLSNPLRLFTASEDRSVRVWDPIAQGANHDEQARFGRELLELRGHKNALSALDLTDKGDLMMTASEDGTVRLWPAMVDSD
ncbi:protein kinase domain-containing protein [Rhodopirellula baltica]|uniref:Serine/threonine protein kinase-related protein n=1 Tax=Rhodopirellula baltica WH47 TaxID=991778 RepID=F2AZ80_RHOBT|nr:protein kinase [Rhodopirellula baltica]EGF25025.1 Serine/threonine protein kinase-related protein [Rhodopirellula baltica WH47]